MQDGNIDMTLYHGSNVEVKEPKILKPSRGLDFGAGFYTTTNRDQAIAFALRVTRNRGNGVAPVTEYEIDTKLALQPASVCISEGVVVFEIQEIGGVLWVIHVTAHC